MGGIDGHVSPRPDIQWRRNGGSEETHGDSKSWEERSQARREGHQFYRAAPLFGGWPKESVMTELFFNSSNWHWSGDDRWKETVESEGSRAISPTPPSLTNLSLEWKVLPKYGQGYAIRSIPYLQTCSPSVRWDVREVARPREGEPLSSRPLVLTGRR